MLVINGDMPLITGEAIADLLAAHTRRRGGDAGHDGARRPDGYGRIVRAADGGVERVVETKVEGDATEEELAIREVDAGLYSSTAPPCAGPSVSCERPTRRARGTCPTSSPPARGRRGGAGASPCRPGARPRGQRPRRSRLVTATGPAAHPRAHQRAGVTIVDPASTLIEADVAIGPTRSWSPRRSCAAHPDRQGLRDRGPRRRSSTARSATGRGRALLPPGRDRRDGGKVGPFAYLRPGAELRERSKAGTFVEMKNSTSARGRRCRTCPTSATRRWASAPTSVPARSRPTTTATPSTPRHRRACGSPFTPRWWRP